MCALEVTAQLLVSSVSMKAVSGRRVNAFCVAKFGYRRVKQEDGSFNTVMWKIPDIEDENLYERIRSGLEGLKPAPKINAPKHSDSDLCTLYPIADAHIGMMAWGDETGEDYDTDIAVDRLQNWIGQAVESAPKSETAIILGLGDLLHADDTRNQTPASKHALDVDTRHFKTIDMAITCIASCIEIAAKKHERVIVRILRGNHDEHAHLAVLFALSERYRNNPRIEVQKDPSELQGHNLKPSPITMKKVRFSKLWSTGRVEVWRRLRRIDRRDGSSLPRSTGLFYIIAGWGGSDG